MTWAKLDDRFHENRKIKRVWKTYPAALGLHVMALTYCAGNETDGLVDPEFVGEKMPREARRAAAVDALVAEGLWAPEGDGWRLNNYLEFNPSRADLEEKRRKDAERKAAGRNSDSRRSPEGIQEESARPDPTRPVPDLTTEKTASSPGPEVELCLLLADLIRQRDPKWKGPVASWHVHMRRLINDREGDTNEIERTMRWSQADSFWQTNILGAESFRKQYTKLLLQSSSPRRSSNPERDERRARGAAALRLLQSGELA